eukprot:g4502.t1
MFHLSIWNRHGTLSADPKGGMSLHGRKAVQLLQDLKRARWLPPFNDKVVKEVAEEINNDSKEMERLAEQDRYQWGCQVENSRIPSLVQFSIPRR